VFDACIVFQASKEWLKLNNGSACRPAVSIDETGAVCMGVASRVELESHRFLSFGWTDRSIDHLSTIIITIPADASLSLSPSNGWRILVQKGFFFSSFAFLQPSLVLDQRRL
jgi:hypothetical protein